MLHYSLCFIAVFNNFFVSNYRVKDKSHCINSPLYLQYLDLDTSIKMFACDLFHHSLGLQRQKANAKDTCGVARRCWRLVISLATFLVSLATSHS